MYRRVWKVCDAFFDLENRAKKCNLNIPCETKSFCNLSNKLQMEATEGQGETGRPSEISQTLKPDPKNKKSWKNKRKKNKEDQNSGNAQKVPRASPNYFLAVQITNPAIKGGMKAIQDHIATQDKRLKQSIVNVATAHLTLFLLHLPDEEAVNEASTILQENKKSIIEIFEPLSTLELDVGCLGNFNDEVLFAKIKLGAASEKLEDLAKYLKEKFDKLKSTNKFVYKPHITLMKMSKIRQRKNKIRKIKKDYYNQIKNVHFGIEKIKSVQLLSMMKKKQPDGYYHCDSEIFFDEPNEKANEVEQFSEFLASYVTVSAYCKMTRDESMGKDEEKAATQICEFSNSFANEEDLMKDKVDVNSNILCKDNGSGLE